MPPAPGGSNPYCLVDTRSATWSGQVHLPLPNTHPNIGHTVLNQLTTTRALPGQELDRGGLSGT